jgi:hypothetical protein
MATVNEDASDELIQEAASAVKDASNEGATSAYITRMRRMS